MKILGIETSCDETAVCIVEATGSAEAPVFKVLGNALYSQAKTHAEYGGVYPSLAKREHGRNLVPLFLKALEEATGKKFPAPLSPTSLGSSPKGTTTRSEGPRPVAGTFFPSHLQVEVAKILEREPELLAQFLAEIPKLEKPDIDLISVTAGPGLEPALWVGINFARALGKIWNIPVLPSNHMEGHMISPLLKGAHDVKFPALALLISGGHTELVLINKWSDYRVLGKTRDDAVGEAFDKVARLLSLPYPGGPEISHLAKEARSRGLVSRFKLPRPMISTADYDFSFSGIKTAVLYALKKLPEITEEVKLEMAREFEDAAAEVLAAKTEKAIEDFGAETLILGGGVIANTFIRNSFKTLAERHAIPLFVPDVDLSTDNAIMIAASGYMAYLGGKLPAETISAQGNLHF